MTALVIRRALLDYARRPLNLVLLVAVPVVIVMALSGELASFSKLVSTTSSPTHLEVATAGWAAAAVAGLAGFFEVIGSRATDRRLAAASMRAAPVVGGRRGASAGLAVAAPAAGLLDLAARSGISDPLRAISAVLVVAVIYVAIGVLVGTLVRSEMNGALIVSVIWMLDVFVGAGLGGGSSVITRVFPMHFPTMVLTSQAAHHGGPIGDVGWSLIWAIGLSSLAIIRLAVTTRPAIRRTAGPVVAGEPAPQQSEEPALSLSAATTVPTPPSAVTIREADPVVHRVRQRSATHLGAAFRAALRDYGRNRVLWVLLLVVPVLFIALAAEQTPTKPMPVELLHGARQFTAMISLRHVHAAQMAAIASALLAGIAGLFIVTGSADGDRRLVLAGFRPRQVLAGHLGVVAGAATLTTAVSLAVSAAFFAPQQWVQYAGGVLLIALTYAMIGVLLGPLTGRLGGLYLILLLAMVDVGYGQTVMFKPLPPTWGAYLPARGAGRLIIDGAFGTSTVQIGYLLLALGWLAALSTAAALVFRARIGLSPGRGTFAAPLTAAANVHDAIGSSPRSACDDAAAEASLVASSHPTPRTEPKYQTERLP